MKPLLRKTKLTMCQLVHPFPTINVDGSKNSHGLIQYTTIQQLRLSTHLQPSTKKKQNSMSTNVGDVDIIIGTDWLKHHNPSIDWAHDALPIYLMS